MVKIRVKAVKVGNSVRVALPVEILREASISAGDTLLIDLENKTGRIVLEKESSSH